MSSSSRVSQVIAILKVIVLVGVVTWLVMTFPTKDWQVLVEQDKNWWMLGQAFVVILIAHLISFWRWLLLVQALGVVFSLADAIRLGFLGTLLNMVSVGSVGGDVFKAIEAARNAPSKRAEVVASVLVDRAVGLLGLVLVSSLSLSFAIGMPERMRWIWVGALVLSAIGVTGLFTIVAFGKHAPIRWLTPIPILGPVLFRVAKACMIFEGRPRLVCELILSSMLVHSCFAIGCWLISDALYSQAPSLVRHFMTIPPAIAASTLPLTPGGVGIQEAAIQSLFKEWPDLPEAYSGLIVAGVFRMMLVCVTLIGAVYYFAGMRSSASSAPAGNSDSRIDRP